MSENLYTEWKKKNKDPKYIDQKELYKILSLKEIDFFICEFFRDLEKVFLKHNVIFSFFGLRKETEDGKTCFKWKGEHMFLTEDKTIKEMFSFLTEQYKNTL